MHKSYHWFKNQILHLGGEALWVILGQILSVVVLFGGVRLMTQVLSPHEYGKLAIIMSLVNGALYSVGQALKMTATRYYSVMVNDKTPNWYWDFFSKTIRYSTISLAVMVFLCFFLSSGLGNDWVTGFGWAIATVLAFIVLINAIAYGVQNGARNRKVLVFHQVLFDGGRICFAFIIAYSLSGSAVNAVSGFVLAGCMILISQLYFLLKLKKTFYIANSNIDTDRIHQLYSYIWPLLIGGALGWVQMFSDRWALKSLSSYSDVGIYFAIYQTMYSFWIYVSLMLGNFLGTIFFSKIKDGSDPVAHMKMLKMNEYVAIFYFACVLICFILLMPLKEWISSLLFADEYRAAAALLPWMALSGGIYGIGQQLLYSVYGGLSSRKIIPIKASSAVVAIILHFIGAFYWGVEGVVFGGLIFSFFYMSTALKAHLNEKQRVLNI